MAVRVIGQVGTVTSICPTPWQPTPSVQSSPLQGLSLLAYCKGIMSLPSQGPAPVRVWGPGLLVLPSNRTKLHMGATFLLELSLKYGHSYC